MQRRRKQGALFIALSYWWDFVAENDWSIVHFISESHSYHVVYFLAAKEVVQNMIYAPSKRFQIQYPTSDS